MQFSVKNNTWGFKPHSVSHSSLDVRSLMRTNNTPVTWTRWKNKSCFHQHLRPRESSLRPSASQTSAAILRLFYRWADTSVKEKALYKYTHSPQLCLKWDCSPEGPLSCTDQSDDSGVMTVSVNAFLCTLCTSVAMWLREYTSFAPCTTSPTPPHCVNYFCPNTLKFKPWKGRYRQHSSTQLILVKILGMVNLNN